jgi:hypothetical protein
MYFGRLKGLRRVEMRPRAERLLADLGLWERRHETVGSYSREEVFLRLIHGSAGDGRSAGPAAIRTERVA